MEAADTGKTAIDLLRRDEPVDPVQRIVAFLEFDSRERKIKHKQEFTALQARLGERFKTIQKEKNKPSQEKSSPSKESAPYTGTQ